MNRHPKIIGITGGISSGKSAIGRMLASLGSEYIDADEMCHRLFLVHELKKRLWKGLEILFRISMAKLIAQDLGKLCFRTRHV